MKNYLFYITPERIDGCNRSSRKITLDDRMDTGTVKKMNARPLPLSLNKIKHYNKKLTAGSEPNELTLNV